MGGPVELPPDHAALGANGTPDGIDVDSLHRGQVDHQPAVGDGAPCDVVTAASDGDLQVVVAPEVDGVDHICGAEAACDDRRTLVDEPVVDHPGLVVAGVSGSSTWPENCCRI